MPRDRDPPLDRPVRRRGAVLRQGGIRARSSRTRRPSPVDVWLLLLFKGHAGCVTARQLSSAATTFPAMYLGAVGGRSKPTCRVRRDAGVPIRSASRPWRPEAPADDGGDRPAPHVGRRLAVAPLGLPPSPTPTSRSRCSTSAERGRAKRSSTGDRGRDHVHLAGKGLTFADVYATSYVAIFDLIAVPWTPEQAAVAPGLLATLVHAPDRLRAATARLEQQLQVPDCVGGYA